MNDGAQRQPPFEALLRDQHWHTESSQNMVDVISIETVEYDMTNSGISLPDQRISKAPDAVGHSQGRPRSAGLHWNDNCQFTDDRFLRSQHHNRFLLRLR